MDSTDFVAALRRIKPKLAHLLSAGFSLPIAEELLERYEVRVRDVEPVVHYPTHLGVLNLIEAFDCSSLEIGMIEFSGHVQEHEGVYYFALFESVYPIGIDTSGSVFVYFDTVVGCARSSEEFLEALAFVAELLTARILGGEIKEDEVDRSVSLAGGEEYRGFYVELLS